MRMILTALVSENSEGSVVGFDIELENGGGISLEREGDSDQFVDVCQSV
jgi:hypothetical protein